MSLVSLAVVLFLSEPVKSYVHDASPFISALEPVDDSLDGSSISTDSESTRRRMQFTTTTSGPLTAPPSMPPTPHGSTVYRDDTNPFVFVDFGTHISWESAGTFCEEQLGTTLATVDRLNQQRINESAQIDLMKRTCQGEGDPNVYSDGHPDCWIGLRYSETTTLFEWQNGQSLDPPTNPGGASETYWRPGTNTPTAFTFLSGARTVCHHVVTLHHYVLSPLKQSNCRVLQFVMHFLCSFVWRSLKFPDGPDGIMLFGIT